MPVLRTGAFNGPPERQSRVVGTHSAWDRVRPGQPEWPTAESWARLQQRLKGSLEHPRSPLSSCPPRRAHPAVRFCRASGIPISWATNQPLPRPVGGWTHGNHSPASSPCGLLMSTMWSRLFGLPANTGSVSSSEAGVTATIAHRKAQTRFCSGRAP
jgi:hypothetical protein